MVVEAEFNRTNKTTLRSEWSCVPEKEKREQKIQKQFLTRAGMVRDVLRKLRNKLRKMSDEELIKFGKEVRRPCGESVSAAVGRGKSGVETSRETLM